MNVEVILTKDKVLALNLHHTVCVEDAPVRKEPTEVKDKGGPCVLHQPDLILRVQDKVGA